MDFSINASGHGNNVVGGINAMKKKIGRGKWNRLIN